ncbi:MAG: NAD(P)/FAD-dependent oxidoreductase [Pseudomonadales bacterium]|nr:NAD(P)/FAD-dependent oxidoreductase [Pseudomonadales bacterium]
MPAQSDKPEIKLDAIVIGAGFSGMYMLKRLRDELGLNTRLYEAGDGVGGTWYWNRYPGARCDSESFYYCYSFSEALLQEWEWSSKYPEQPEILSYLNHVADRFDLRRNIQLETRVTSAKFDEATNRWHILTEQGEHISAQFLISAVGCLSTANVPDIKGLDSFKGDWYHTGKWPHEGVDFTGKRVGLIGTGSTGIQATPVIAAEADHLTIFQRTANFSVPARNVSLTDDLQREIKGNYDEIWRAAKAGHGGFPYIPSDRSALDYSEEERNAIYEDIWKVGGFKFLWGSFSDIMVNEKANDTAADFLRAKIRATVKDPQLAEKLIPNDHPYGAKRPPIDTNYFETFNRDNVSLVDVKKAPITEITEKGVLTADDEYELDIIVFATGFDAMTGTLLSIDIQGRNGLTLAEKWQEGPKTYLGLQISGFPNMFTISGPGSPSVLSNMPVSIEQHVEWISDCIESMREKSQNSIEATLQAESDWVEHVNEIAQMTLFWKANSWYLGANIPGKTRIFMPYAGGIPMYRQRCDEVAEKDYEGFLLSA